jgi:hypothetical protein
MVIVRKVVYPKQVFKKINFHTKKVKNNYRHLSSFLDLRVITGTQRNKITQVMYVPARY